jgi:hypothetical protein
MELAFTGEIWHWRGPSPYHFVTVPDDGCAELEAIAPMVSYGWGMIPVAVQVGETRWTTSLWPKDDAYVVPQARGPAGGGPRGRRHRLGPPDCGRVIVGDRS